MPIAALLAGFYVAWNIGANDSANCIGTAVGGRILPYRRAIVILILFVLLGATLEGWKNMRTVGEGILVGPKGTNPLSDFPLAAIASLLASGYWVMMATTMGLPVSTSQSMVGSVVGAGLLLSYTEGGAASVRLGVFTHILVSWLLNPAIAAVLAFLLFRAISLPFRRMKNIILLNRMLVLLMSAAIAASAYSLGANDVGSSAGAVYASFRSDSGLMRVIGLLGGIALAAGALSYGRKVMYTVGMGISKLDPLTASAAQFGAAITVWSFVQFGIPVSTTQAIVGAVAGAGLVRGVAAVSRRKLRRIWVAWTLTPLITCMLSFIIGRLFLGLSPR